MGLRFLADSLCALLPRGRHGVVLVVRLEAIGDHFLWMQSGAHEISRFARKRGDRVVLITNRVLADYARTTGLWDEVLAVDLVRLGADLRYRVRTLLGIRRLGAELMIQPRSARFFFLDDAIARTCGARVRIGSAGTLLNMTPWQRRIGDRFYTRLIPVAGATAHETVRNAGFVADLTGSATVRSLLPRPARENSRGRVVVALGASYAGRVWPIEKLAALIRHISRTCDGCSIQLYGLESERRAAEQLMALAGGQIDNLVGKTTLQTLVDAIAAARLTVCNETSAYHIAMAYDTPVLCFLGGGHYGLFAPYPRTGGGATREVTLSASMECFGCNWRCKYERAAEDAFPCVASIPVDAALDAVDTLLDARTRHHDVINS